MDFSKYFKIGLLALVAINVLVIYWTKARQGLVTLALGIGLVAIIYLWQRSRKISIGFASIGLVGLVLIILGMLQVGPLTKWMFKPSITDRGYNWRAAVEMFRDHPIFGVGLDRFGAYFNQYRDAKYPLLYGYTQTVSNAHNVFLEYFATAGIFAGSLYLILILFVGFRALFVIKKYSGNEQLVVAGVVAAWLVFVVQSFISVDTLTISVWGWVLSGSIVGLSIPAKDAVAVKGLVSDRTKANQKVKQSDSYRGIIFACLMIALTFVIVPMYRNETSFARFARISAPTDVNTKQLYKDISSKTFNGALMNPNYKFNIALIMGKNGYVEEATSQLKATLKEDKRNLAALATLASIYEGEKKFSGAISLRTTLSQLDPFGAENLLILEQDYLATGNTSMATNIKKSIQIMAPGTDVANRAEAALKPKK